MAKWYAVQETSEDAWDNGSFDMDEAKAMLKKQGYGLIAVIEDDFCEDEIKFDDLFSFQADYTTEELAELVYDADKWDVPYMDAVMEELCTRAGQTLRDMEPGEKKSELLQEVRDLEPDFWKEPDEEYTQEMTDEDTWWYLMHFCENRPAYYETACVIQDVLGVELV